VRSDFLPFARPDFDTSELEEVREVLESGWLTTGPKTRQFEAQFAAAVGARNAVAVNSCTAAMHLALEALDLKPDDEVITTTYTFAATAEVVRYFNARPVLVDVCPEDLNIDPTLVEAAVTPRTRAIIPVHVGGLAADLDPLYALADAHGLVCPAPGCTMWFASRSTPPRPSPLEKEGCWSPAMGPSRSDAGLWLSMASAMMPGNGTRQKVPGTMRSWRQDSSTT
jgi:hypothetical protein